MRLNPFVSVVILVTLIGTSPSAFAAPPDDEKESLTRQSKQSNEVLFFETRVENSVDWKTFTQNLIGQFTKKMRYKWPLSVLIENFPENIKSLKSLYINDFPNKAQGKIPYRLTQLLIAWYAEKGELQGIEQILEGPQKHSIQDRLGYLNTCSKYLKNNLAGRQYIIEKLDLMVNDTEESPVHLLVVRAYVENILKIPYDEYLYLKGELYLDIFLDKISKMSRLTHKASSEAEPSDSDFSIYSSCSDEDEESNSDDNIENESLESFTEFKYATEDTLRFLKGCLLLHSDQKESTEIFDIIPELTVENLHPLFKTLKKIGFLSLREETKEAIRKLVLNVYNNRNHNHLPSTILRNPLLYAQVLPDMFEGTEGKHFEQYKKIVELLNGKKKVGKEEVVTSSKN